MTEQEALLKISQTSYLSDLKIILDEIQTPKVCLAAVQKYGYALEYVKDQTPEICLAAVQQKGNALGYVKEQNPEICLEAIQEDRYALEYVNIVPNPDFETTYKNLIDLKKKEDQQKNLYSKI